MFPRVTTVRRGDKTYKYLQIVEAYRRNGRTTQRVVANLGRLDQLDGKLDDLLVALSEYAKRQFTRDDQIGCLQRKAYEEGLRKRSMPQRRVLFRYSLFDIRYSPRTALATHNNRDRSVSS